MKAAAFSIQARKNGVVTTQGTIDIFTPSDCITVCCVPMLGVFLPPLRVLVEKQAGVKSCAGAHNSLIVTFDTVENAIAAKEALQEAKVPGASGVFVVYRPRYVEQVLKDKA